MHCASGFCKNGLLSWEINYNTKERKQKSYALVIVKRTVGCTENQSSWPQANLHYACTLFLQQSGNIECTITGVSLCYFSDSLQSGLELPCTLHFSGNAKAHKLSASKILININNDRI